MPSGEGDRDVLILGAGASLAPPARRPLFDAIRQALLEPLAVDLDPALGSQLAPEALLSRLMAAGLDIDSELRRMLSGGSPNALHRMAVELLRRGSPVWTTNLDELVETAAEHAQTELHRLLPGDNPNCSCPLGHLVKVHGTLSGQRVLARSEDVLAPLPELWLQRLAGDLRGSHVAIVGYAGSDIDLRSGLRDSFPLANGATWFGRDDDREWLTRRFAAPLAAGRLVLAISQRPDLAALQWGEARDLIGSIPAGLLALAREPVVLPSVRAAYRPNHLLRARVLDDFGRVTKARRQYERALLQGPRRRLAARALYSTGMIHGARWRPPVTAFLNAACAMPVRWHAPHRRRLPYLTWNVPPDRRLAILERSLARLGEDPQIVMATANAAKEVDPRRAVELGVRAQQEAMSRRDPADIAWATFTLSLALRWTGDVDAAAAQAERLADGYDSLAGPSWVAWGHFESGATKVLKGELADARRQLGLAIEVFTAAGSIFAFDGWCAMIAACRAIGDLEAQRDASRHAHRLLDADPLRGRFKREVLMVEDAEYSRQQGDFDQARALYTELSHSPTLAQELLGRLGLGEIQRQRGGQPSHAWEALKTSEALGFGYGQVHAAITLGLADEITADQAEQRIAASIYDPPARPGVTGLTRFCQGSDPAQHVLCFP